MKTKTQKLKFCKGNVGREAHKLKVLQKYICVFTVFFSTLCSNIKAEIVVFLSQVAKINVDFYVQFEIQSSVENIILLRMMKIFMIATQNSQHMFKTNTSL